MRQPDELRQLTAGRLLSIWRACGAEAEEAMERSLLCNAQVLAECCLFQGEAVFSSREAVLEALTPREMETLLRRLAGGGNPAAAVKNPAFDMERFTVLQEG